MSDDFLPTASAEMLRLRAELLHRLRAFFRGRGLVEVETPLLSADTVVEPHLDPVAVRLPDDARRPELGRTMWLQTSPEFHMKRLLAGGGLTAIFQVCRAFRIGERGRLHNPEFTMVEWYRAGDSYDAGMTLLSDLAEEMLSSSPAERISYRDAFIRWCNIDPLMCEDHELADVLQQQTGEPAAGAGRDEQLNLLLAACVEPRLGRGRPTVLYDYPASQASLARVRDGEPPAAERFELYIEGVELANGYHELTDADELRRRMQQNAAARRREGKPPLPDTNRLLGAMEHGLPACTGAALGFDRLVMLAVGALHIDEVLTFPVERA